MRLNGNPVGDKGAVLIIEAVGIKLSVRDLGLQDCSTCKSAAGLFDPCNPTGHYALDLADPFERGILERLKDLDRMDEKSGLDNFINIRHEGAAISFPLLCRKAPGVDLLEVADLQNWPVPESGVLHFDYVETKKIPERARYVIRPLNPHDECSKRLMLRGQGAA